MGSDLNRIVPLQTGGSRPPLYCVHAVSGSPYSYVGLARLLGTDQPVYGYEAPGFENDRIPVSSLPALAEEYTEILRGFQPDGDYRLLGWSLGGVLVFEMARRLVAAGAKVANLILVDAGQPEIMELPPEREILRRYIRDMMGRSDESPAALEMVFQRWPAGVEPASVFDAVEAAGILPEEIDADLLANQYAVFRAHLAAFYSFEVTGQYAGPVLHIRATQSPDEDMRWDRVAPDLTEHVLPGTHHSIWTGGSLVAMSAIVRQSLSN